MKIFVDILSMLQDSFAHHLFFSLGLLFIFGFLLENLVDKIKLPSITGYILAGIIIGSSGLDLIHPENTEQLHLISEITLSIIAVIIGAEFSFKKLKKYGFKIVILTICQIFFTFSLITAAMFFFKMPIYIAILFGAIGAATAPAAIVVLVENMRVRGDFVNYLYGIVALDDAGTVIIFSIAFAIFASMVGTETVTMTHAILHGIKEIFYSMIVGASGGLIAHYLIVKKRSWNQIKIAAVGVIFLISSIAISLHLSPLITNMTFGMLIINMSDKNVRILKIIEPLTAPLYALFFAIAGVELNIALFGNKLILLLAVVYVLVRAFGKYMGIYIPSLIFKYEKNVKNYLGLALMPQAGVAIGLAIFVRTSPILQTAPEVIKLQITEMINIILISIIFNELFGPPIAKYGIEKGTGRK